MKTEQRIQKLFEATPDVIQRVDALLNGEVPAAPQDMRLLTFAGAAKALGVSRQTVWRMVKEGKLETVEVRVGRHRVPASRLAALVNTKKEGV